MNNISRGTPVFDHIQYHQDAVQKTLESLHDQILTTAEVLVAALIAGHKVIAFGNGGSATQASHFVGELLGRYKSDRRGLAAIALASDPAVVTCISNDFSYTNVFERQIEALVRPVMSQSHLPLAVLRRMYCVASPWLVPGKLARLRLPVLPD